MCNAANHSYACDCGFGGDTGGGRGGGHRWGSIQNFADHYAPPSFGWSKDADGTVASYITPNAHCPVCGATVWFYRSPYNGRGFFDRIGWPWPKHPCTDNLRQPRRTTRSSSPANLQEDTAWHSEGWAPLLSLRVGQAAGRPSLRGDFKERFVDLLLPAGQVVDRESPGLLKPIYPYLYRVTVLASDPYSTSPLSAVAFEKRLVSLGDDVLWSATNDDAKALQTVGAYLLWTLDEPEAAKPYLEAAAKRGNAEAAIDLLTIACFKL